MEIRTHKDLDVWKQSIDFVIEIYSFTKKYPAEECYGLTSQTRRAAVSIPSNIAEGAARNHSKEFRQFLYIALSSCSEIDTQLIIAEKLNYIDNQNFLLLTDKLTAISKMLQGLIKSLNIS